MAEARPLTIQGMKPVGNYAYSIDFSDGHGSGIKGAAVENFYQRLVLIRQCPFDFLLQDRRVE